MAARRISRARPTRMRSMTPPGPTICYMRANPKGRPRRALGAQRRLPTLVQPCCATRSRTASSLPTRSARPPPRPERTGAVTQPFRLPAGGAIDRSRVLELPVRRARLSRAIPATRSPRPCSRTASGSSRAASSTTVRAASSRPGWRSRRRWFSSKPGPLPNRTAGRPRSRSTTGCAPPASTPGRASAPISARSSAGSCPLFPAGFYYKTFMRPPALWALAVGAAAAPDGGARPGAVAARSGALRQIATPIAMCWSSAAGRPGSPPRWPPDSSGARVILADSDPVFGGALLRRAYRIGSAEGTAWAADVVAELRRAARDAAACRDDGRRPLRRQLPRRRRAGRRTFRPAAPSGLPRQRLWHIRARRVVLATGAIGAPARLPRQRPARHHAGGRGRDLPASLRGRCRDGAPCCSPITTTPIRSPPRLAAGRGRGRRDRRSARRGRVRRRGAWSPACRSIRRIAVVGTAGRRRAAPGVASAAGDGRNAPKHRHRLRPAGAVGRLEPERASLRASARQAAVRRAARRVCPGRDRGGGRLRRRGARQLRARRLPCRGRRGRRPRRGGMRLWPSERAGAAGGRGQRRSARRSRCCRSRCRRRRRGAHLSICTTM